MTENRASVRRWLVDPLDREVQRAVNILASAEDVQVVALMPDIHLAQDVCVGCVLATRHLIYPQAVGGDMGCGMTTVALDCQSDLLESPGNAAKILRRLEGLVPILKHKDSPPYELPSTSLTSSSLRKSADREGRYQLGTLGRGNHFIEIQADEEDGLWICVHSGSRSIGRKIMAHHLAIGDKSEKFTVLDVRTQQGKDYIHNHEWALNYAKLNREILLQNSCSIFEDIFGVHALPQTQISCHHNQVRLEEVDGSSLWVHRKGAISAKAGEEGIIPGSMGSPSFHVQGRGCTEALNSSSHGAGRTCSRTETRKRVSSKDLVQQMKGVWFDNRKKSTLRDEAPSAYRDITKVMRAQKDLTCITRRLRPVLNFKG